MSFKEAIIFLIIFVSSTASINCDKFQDPGCKTFTCTTDTCHIQCSAEESCHESVIDCGTSTNCTIDCTDKFSCGSAQIQCPPNGVCNINCQSQQDYSCLDIDIRSHSNTITNLNCLGNSACFNSFLQCDSDECNIHCHGESACTRLEIDGTNSKLLTISDCTGSTPTSDTCNNLKVHCPANTNNKPVCILPGKGIFTPINIYAINSWNDINISSYDSSNIISGQMHCASSFSSNCSIQNNDNDISMWECSDNALLCATLQLPTDNPTLEPTFIPTLNPTVNPTLKPSTISPTYHPSIPPTFNPTKSPMTMLPTLFPTVVPTHSPTVIPTQGPTKQFIIMSTQGMNSTEETNANDNKITNLLSHLRYGILVGIVIVLIFICVIYCVWKYWQNGKGAHAFKTDKKMPMTMNDQSDGSVSDVDIEMTEKKNEQHLNDSNAQLISNANEETKKRKHKKKKKKKKKRHKTSTSDGSNAGDYQKQTDDPFSGGAWNELADFN